MQRYYRPSSLQAALAALAERSAEAPFTPLAGGTDYYPARVVQAQDDAILDLAALPGLRGIEVRADHWWIPCLTTWTDLIETPLPPLFNCLKQAARQIGGIQIQNAGTVAGNICNASPAADGVPCLLAMDAEVELASGSGTRILKLQEFVLGPRKTVRRPDELLLGLRIPRLERGRLLDLHKAWGTSLPGDLHRHGCRRIPRTADGRIIRPRVAVGSCSSRALRLPALETALTGRRDEHMEILDEHLAALSPIDDIRASATYRLHAVRTLLSRTIAA